MQPQVHQKTPQPPEPQYKQWLAWLKKYRTGVVVALAGILLLVILITIATHNGFNGPGAWVAATALQVTTIIGVVTVSESVITNVMDRRDKQREKRESQAKEEQARRDKEVAEQKAETDRKLAEDLAEGQAAAERAINRDNQEEAAMQAYFDWIAELMFDRGLGNIESSDMKARTIARIKTLTLLQRLDGTRVKVVLHFLREAKLIMRPPSYVAGSEKTVAIDVSVTFKKVNEALDPRNEPVIRLDGCNLSDKDLAGAELSDTSLVQAELSGAKLSGAKLVRAKLIRAKLVRADLVRADLSGADLSDAYLFHADLRGAHLIHADLSGAHLNDAYLIHADLSGAKLSGANLDSADLSGAIMPDGTVHP